MSTRRRYRERMRMIVGGLLLVSLALLSGCSHGAPVEPVPSARTTAIPAAGTTPAVSGQPQQAFDGDCESIFTAATVSRVVGEPLVPSTAAVTGRGIAIPALGGVQCVWSDSHAQPRVWFTVFPAAGLDQVIADAGRDQPWCYGSDAVVGAEGVCSFSTVVGSYWFAGVLSAAEGTGIRATDAIDELTAELDHIVASDDATPPSPTRDVAAWTVPSCEEFTARMASAQTPFGTGASAERGSMGGEAGPGFYGALRGVGWGSCLFTAADGTFIGQADLFPGAGWFVSDVANRPGGSAAAIPGAVQSAVLITDGHPEYFYSDGVNLLDFTPGGASPDTAAVEAFLQQIAGAVAG